MIVLDTMILSYAVGGEHPLREASRRLIAAIADRRVPATTTVDVVQEFVHSYSRRRPRAVAAAHGRQYAILLAPLLRPSERELTAGLELFERSPALDAFDAVLAATAIAHGADALVSADRGFAGIRGLRHVDPASGEYERLLGQ